MSKSAEQIAGDVAEVLAARGAKIIRSDRGEALWELGTRKVLVTDVGDIFISVTPANAVNIISTLLDLHGKGGPR